MKKLNRGWVKNAAIIFLAVMLLLTFFSNSIMNYSLVEVDTAQPSSGTITTKIRQESIAAANSSYSVEVDSARAILAVYVKDGDEVKVGDKLFELDESDEDPLTTAVDDLNTARLEYQKALLGLADSDYASNNETIRQYRQALQKAIDERSALGASSTTVTAAQAKVDAATVTYNNYSDQLTALNTELEYITSYSSLSSYISAEVIAYETAVAKVSSIEAQMGMSYSEYLQKITSLEADLATLRQELVDLQSAGADSSQISAKQSAVSAVQSELDYYNGRAETMGKLNSDLTSAQTAADSAESVMKAAAATAKQKVSGEISALNDKLNTAAKTKTDAENALNTVKSIATAEDNVTQAQNTLNNALIELSSTQKADSIQNSQALLDLKAMEEGIQKLEEKVKKLEDGTEDGGNTITAKYDGIISGLTAVAGKSTEPGTALAQIEVAEMGYTAEISVENSEASKVKKGAAVDVTSTNWSETITGTVSGIKTDPESGGAKKIITVELEGDVTVGSRLTLGIHLDSASYDIIVPANAVAQDSNGYHVYVLQSKSSPLGTRYIATRVDVQKLAEDDTQVAISGGVTRYDSIITRTSGTISDKDYVRLAAN